MNEFYSIAEENKDPNNSWQLTNLGKQRILAIVGSRQRGDWGERGNSSSNTYYTATTAEDYDRHFAYTLGSTKPPYDIPKLLNFHLNYYLNNAEGSKDKFIKQMKYVVLPILKKQNGKEPYIDVLKEWIEENEMKPKSKSTTIINKITTGDINAPTQFQQESSNSKQIQEITYSKENILELFTLLKADIEKLNTEAKESIRSEIEYGLKQLEKGKDVRQQLLNIGAEIREIGVSFFVNLVSSGVFEIIKPALGLG